MMKYDYLIVGSGLFGATFARLATDSGKRCLVIDKRPHLGGNVYCESVEGINVHKYGPHVFHTSDKKVWEFVNRFVEFNRFTLMTVANYKGRLYNLPFNMNTFHQMWGVRTPDEAMCKIEEERKEIGRITNLEEQAISLVGRGIYEVLIKGYTEKQWGRACTELPSFIIRRLPVRYTFDNNYFNDTYQGVPIGGYNILIDGLLKGVDTQTGVDFFDGMDKTWRNVANKLVFTGKIDDFYHQKLGSLQYRSLRFETETLDIANYQGGALMNYTDKETPYTRIIEHKHFETFGAAVERNPKTLITREYPAEYKLGMEAYYPINDEDNNNLYQRYKALADAETDVIFGGRLAEYRYYDMASVIKSAMNRWDTITSMS
ncbi:UDP-galactopyranose mutase [Prevotella sp. P3-122]|uniref:UDP-galactopyranose mutase n=1 Tax=Prevotella sp. P3-122 TaxID=2024223 RepID=UPI001F0ABF4C|nr:UDP-galactopyranose mutase [Prevotella sp. P3-122]